MAFFQTDDNVKLYYEIFGQGDKTILFVHGWMDSGDSFRAAAGDLAQRYQIVVYDQRGHGRSETPADGYNMTRLATDLRNLVEFLEPQALTLVGYSMGSHVIYEYVKLFGDADLDKIVISVMSPSLINEENPKLSLGGNLTWKTAVERLAGTNQHYVESRKVAYPLYRRTHSPNEKLRQYYEAAAQLDPGAMVRLEIAMYAADYWDVLPSFTRPTLVLSAQDDIYSRAVHEEQARRIPDARVVIIPNCGHMVLMEDPEAYIAELEKFIQ